MFYFCSSSKSLEFLGPKLGTYNVYLFGSMSLLCVSGGETYPIRGTVFEPMLLITLGSPIQWGTQSESLQSLVLLTNWSTTETPYFCVGFFPTRQKKKTEPFRSFRLLTPLL